MELCAQQTWKWNTNEAEGNVLCCYFPNDRFSLLGNKAKSLVKGFPTVLFNVSEKKKTTCPTRQCCSHSVNALVQWRGNVEIMLLINTDRTLTKYSALTALVLRRNNYCLRTKMYILAHDVSVNIFFSNYNILFDIKFKELETLCYKINWNALTWSRPLLSSYTNKRTLVCINACTWSCAHTNTN